jgi:hypothetical protein
MKKWIIMVLVLIGYSSWGWATPYSGADITRNGSTYTVKDDDFYDLGNTVYVCSTLANRYTLPWVQYEITLTAGTWRFGVNGYDDRSGVLPCYTYECPSQNCQNFYLEVQVSSPSSGTLPSQEFTVPYSESGIQHGYAEIEIPTDDTYTVTFGWRPYLVYAPPYHLYVWNMRIFSIFADNTATPPVTPHCHEVKLNHSISGLLFCKRV